MVNLVNTTSGLDNGLLQELLKASIRRESPEDIEDVEDVTDNSAADTVIVYNPANIDSILTAAVIANHEGIQRAFPAGDYYLNAQFKRYVWVGIDPSKATLKALKEKEHVGYFQSFPNAPIKAFSRVVESYTPVFEDCPSTHTLLERVTLPIAPSHHLTVYWALAMAVQKLQACQSDVSLEDQAFVYANLQHARLCLANKMPYEPMAYTDSMEKSYLIHLKMLKVRISQLWNFTEFPLDGKTVRIPIINIGSDLSPWAIKLISCTYDHVVTYEHGRHSTTYTLFSRTPGFRAVFEKYLSKSPNNERILFSGEL